MRTYYHYVLPTIIMLCVSGCGMQSHRNDVWSNYSSHRTVITEGNASPTGNDSSYSQPHGFGMCGSTQTFGCE